MSIINQVLKDLDQQRGPNDGLQVAALQGVGLVRGERLAIWPIAAVVAGVIVALAIGYQFTSSSDASDDYQAAAPLSLPEERSVKTPEPRVSVSGSETHEAEPATGTIETVVVAEASTVSTDAEDQHVEPSPALPADQPEPAEAEDKPVAAPVIKTLSIRQQADHAFASAQRARENQDRVAAERHYQAALDLYPQHLAARLQLAGLYLDRELNNRASSLLEEGLVVNGMDKQLVKPYAQLLAARGELDEALRLLKPLTETPYPDAESLALSAAIHARLNRHGDAAALYASAIKLDASQGNWWLGLALSLEQQGENAGAQRAYRRAADLPLADNVQVFVTERIHELGSRTEGS